MEVEDKLVGRGEVQISGRQNAKNIGFLVFPETF